MPFLAGTAQMMLWYCYQGFLGQNLLDYCAENRFFSAAKSYALIAQKVSV